MKARLDRPLGAPGVYVLPDEPIRELTGVRMDVCAFVGVAPRGPAREPVLDQISRNCRPEPRVSRQLRRTVPVAVESFDEYRRLFGGFEGPGLLPYAVASFFEQGGRRAYIARIVHQYLTAAENSARVAQGTVGGVSTSSGPLILRARNEGSWGNQLRASMSFNSTPLVAEEVTLTTILLREQGQISVGTLLRLSLSGGAKILRFVARVRTRGLEDRPGTVLEASLDVPLPAKPNLVVEVVEADLSIGDGAGRAEFHERQGLSPLHPRWIGAALCYDSQLVFPHESWLDATVRPDEGAAAADFADGKDAYEDITPDDFFDDKWTPGDDEPGDGVTSLVHLPDLSLLIAPDLYSPWPLADVEKIEEPSSLAGPTFQYCVDLEAASPKQEFPEPDLDGLRMDPRTDLDRIEFWQMELVNFASDQQSFITLLDVPPGLNRRQMLTWRARFDSANFNSAYAAAYHPWLKVTRRDDRRDGLVRVPPSAVAAGIIARRELVFGVAHGPANELAAEVVDVHEVVSPPQHDELHPLGINVYLRERDGIRLTAARTLSREPEWRQLSVRRLMTMIRRTLEQQTQWMVFEPNNAALRAEIRILLAGFLRQLFRAGAFRGASEEEAFFVQCDEALNPPYATDAGQVIAHVGVAPSEPIEFIVLRLTRGGDGTLAVEE